MHIQSCEQPKRIFNSYLREFMYVPCGHCKTCELRKSNSWVKRLEKESESHRYTVFLTLTYNEKFVPSIDFSSSLDDSDDYVPAFPQVRHRTDFSLLPEDMTSLDSKSYSLIAAGKGLVRVLNYIDIQKFFKRFRRKIDYYVTDEIKKSCGIPRLRYFCCGEYGPTTFRPHYHLLIWFDSKWLADNFEALLLASWKDVSGTSQSPEPMGRAEWSYVKGNAAVYVAQYVNCRSHLPSLLTFPSIRPFGIGSRCPPIGTLLQSNEEIFNIFNSGAVFQSLPQRDGKAALTLPLFPSFENRLFPKCPRYSKVSPLDRIACYSAYKRFSSREKFQSEEDYDLYLKDCLDLMKKDLFLDLNTFLSSYLCDVTFQFSDIRPLKKLLQVSWRVVHQAAIFGVSLDYYVSRIQLHYDNKEKEKLRSWLTFEEKYSNQYGAKSQDLVLSDLDFVQRCYDSFSSIPTLMISSYDLHEFSLNLECFNLDRLVDYKNMKRLSEIIYKNTSKTKKKNDYLMAHPELLKFGF